MTWFSRLCTGVGGNSKADTNGNKDSDDSKRKKQMIAYGEDKLQR